MNLTEDYISKLRFIKFTFSKVINSDYCNCQQTETFQVFVYIKRKRELEQIIDSLRMLPG